MNRVDADVSIAVIVADAGDVGEERAAAVAAVVVVVVEEVEVAATAVVVVVDEPAHEAAESIVHCCSPRDSTRTPGED